MGRGVIQPPNSPVPLRICLNSADSDDGLGVVEMVLDPGTGPPLHVHPTHGEGFYVLAGELTVQVGDEIVTGGPGSWAYAPKTPRTPWPTCRTGETRVLCVFAPGGFERRFERILAEQAGEPLPEPSTAQTRFLGPPLTERPR